MSCAVHINTLSHYIDLLSIGANVNCCILLLVILCWDTDRHVIIIAQEMQIDLIRVQSLLDFHLKQNISH